MIIDIAKYTSSGGHQINEDSIFCGTDLFIVADGLGGHHGGENASAEAVSYIAGRYRGDISDDEIDQLLEGANTAVNNLNDDSHTTIAVAFISDERMRIANVGDSRVYIFRNNKVYTVTKDHSVCQMAVDMGELSYENIRFSDDRSRLMKVLGNENRLNLKTKYDPVELYDGDAFLICSDGFWEYVHEREMEADLLKADSAESWKRLMLKRQLLKAKDEGDNYSLICGIIHSDRTLSAAPFPTTVVINSTDQPPVKRSKGMLIILILLLLVALATFWLVVGNKLFADTSAIESTDTSISETTESEASETTEALTDESTGQSVTGTEEATSEGEKLLPEATTEISTVESENESHSSTNEASIENTEQPETSPVETTESTPAETEEQIPDQTEGLPSTTGEVSDTAEPDLLMPLHTGIPIQPDTLPEPENSITP